MGPAGDPGLTLEARAMYTSSQHEDTANTLDLDSWTRVDNVTDENDWISAGGFPGFGYLVLGAPRAFVVSASIDF